MDNIGSVKALENYLCKNTNAGSEAIQLIWHLVQLKPGDNSVPSRGFLLAEAEFWESSELAVAARMFIAKRIFAFWRKNLFADLEQNLALFSYNFTYPAEMVISLLQFETKHEELSAKIEQLKAEEDLIKQQKEAFTKEQVSLESKLAENENSANSVEPRQNETTAENKPTPTVTETSKELLEQEDFGAQEQINDKATEENIIEEKEETNGNLNTLEINVLQETEEQKTQEIEKQPKAKDLKNEIKNQITPQLVSENSTESKPTAQVISQPNLAKIEDTTSSTISKTKKKLITTLLSKIQKATKSENQIDDEFEDVICSQKKTVSKQTSAQDIQQKIVLTWTQLQAIETKTLTCPNIKRKLPTASKRNFITFPKIFQAILERIKDNQDRYSLMRVKFLMLQYQSALTRPEGILVFINYGKEAENLLQKLANITNNKDLNHFIHQYLQESVNTELKEHARNFRKTVESCCSRNDLKNLLHRYPLFNKSIIEKYSVLRIIPQVKKVCAEFEHSPDLDKIMREHLGERELHIKRQLSKILAESSIHVNIWDSLRKTDNINRLLKTIKRLRKLPETKRTADTLFTLIVTILRTRQGISFADFKFSLNFIPAALRRHIVRLVENKLQRDLENKVEKILLGKRQPIRRWKKLLQQLHSPQMHSPNIKIYTFQADELWQKLQLISATEEDINKAIDLIFRGTPIPEELRELILAKHDSDFQSKRKSLTNCLRDLNQLVNSEENIYLRRVLVELFQCYGQINFSTTDEELNGYQLSQSISRFYSEPSRITIQLPSHLDPHIGDILSACINEERIRQLTKLQNLDPLVGDY